MGAGKPLFDAQPVEPSAGERLDSWKEIATYLKRDESTVRRWESEGLPVHRHMHRKRAAVYAYKHEVDAWWRYSPSQAEAEEAPVTRGPSVGVTLAVAALAVLAVVFGLYVGKVRDRLLGSPEARDIALGPPEERGPAPAGRISPRAYEAYLKGRYHFQKRTREGFEKSVEYFQEIIVREPAYAPAYAGLADAYNGLAIHGHRPAKDVYPLAMAALVRTLELDGTSSDAHASLGVIKFRFAWDWEDAERLLKHALRLDPENGRAHLGYGVYLERVGRLEESLHHMKRYRDLEPVSPFANLQVAHSLYYLGRYEDALFEGRKTLELDRNYAGAYRHLALVHAAMKMNGGAIAACDKALGLAPQDPVVLSGCGRAYVLSGRPRSARAALDTLRAWSAQNYLDPYFLSEVGTAIYTDPDGRKRVFEWLERAYEERSPNLSYLKMNPAFDALRQDSRFQTLLRRMNFPE